MSLRDPQQVSLRYGQARDALAVAIGIRRFVEDEPPATGKTRDAFAMRLANLKRLGFPPGVNVRKGNKANYTATALASLAVAVQLENMHLNPRVVVRALTASERQVWAFAATALSWTLDKGGEYAPAGDILLLFEPSGLDDLGTQAARAGRYDAPVEEARLLGFGEGLAGGVVHGITVDGRTLGEALCAGLAEIEVEPRDVVHDLTHALLGDFRPDPVAEYLTHSASLLDVLRRHQGEGGWTGSEVARALIHLNGMARTEKAARDVAIMTPDPAFPGLTFSLAVQMLVARFGLPVTPNSPPPMNLTAGVDAVLRGVSLAGLLSNAVRSSRPDRHSGFPSELSADS